MTGPAAAILGRMPQRVSAAVMVGRDAPLAALQEAFADLTTHGGRVAVVGGEAGAGKTRLVTEFVDGLPGARVLVGGCLELGEALMPLAPLAGIVRQLGEELGDGAAEALGPDLAGFLPGRPGGPSGFRANDPYGMFDALRTVLERLADDGPVVVVVEDLHWADRSTLDLVTWLTRNITEAAVLVVATYRSDEMRRSHPLRPVLAELSRLPYVERLELAPLTEAEVVALLTDISDGDLRPDLLHPLVERSEGNPFFAEELLAVAGTTGVPFTLRDILSSRLESMPEPAKEVLRIAAAAGRRVDHRLLERVADLAPADLDAGLRAAVEEQALVAEEDGFRFRHALLQEAVRDQLLPGERSRMARAFTEALRADPSLAGGGADAVDAELAHHATASHDLDLAFTSLVRAAQRARSLFAFNEAQLHYEGAVELEPRVSRDVAAAAPPVWELLRAAAACSRQAGHPGTGVGHLRRAIGLLDEDTDRVVIGGLYAELGEGYWINGQGDEAVAATEAAVQRLEGERTREAAEAFGWKCRLMMLLGRFDEGIEPGRKGVEISREIGAPLELCRAENALGTCLNSLGEVEEGEPRLHEAIAIGVREGFGSDTIRAFINLTSSLRTPGNDLTASARLATEGLAYAAERGVGGSMVDWLRMEYADVQIRQGAWAAARETLGGVRTGWSTGVSGQYFEVSHAQLDLARGDVDAADAHLRRARELAPSIRDPQAIGPQLALAVRIKLARGDTDASAELDELGPMVRDTVVHPALLVVARAAALAALAGDPTGLAQLRRADELLVSRLADATPVVEAAVAGSRTVLEAETARAEGRTDPGLWAAAREAMAVRGFAESELYAGVRLVEALAEAGRAADATDEADSLHARLVDLQEELLRGELLLLTRKHRLKIAGVAPVLGVGGLTGREREVLALLTRGRTNREIGADLFISEKTASVHVSNILAKLDVTNRREAADVGRTLDL